MRKGRYTEEQIVYALRQAGHGAPLTRICRRMGVSPTTFCVWKRRLAGMGVATCGRRSSSRTRIAVEAVGGRPVARQADGTGGALKEMMKP